MDPEREKEARKAPNYYFEYIIKNYFRKSTPLPLNIILPVIRSKPAEIRRQVAGQCRYPEIIDALINDPDPDVVEEAQQNEYWQLLGQYRRLLYLSHDEKIKFIQSEGFPNLLVFVVFETDMRVLEKLYHHPSISVQMLNFLRHYLMDRQDELSVQSLLRLIKSVIDVRRRRILRVTSVFTEGKVDKDGKSIERILSYLLDSDEVVVKSAVNVLKQFDYAIIRKFLLKENPFNEKEPDSEKIWFMLERLKEFFRITPQDQAELGEKSSFTNKKFLQDISERKISLLEYCSNNLEKAQSLITITHAHLDAEERIQEKLREVLNIEELLALINDSTFPKGLSSRIVEILKTHPSRYVQKRISETFLEIYERTRRSLREMEITVNAYFDIIFNSLGYPQIDQIRQTFNILNSAKKLTHGFIDKSRDSYDDYEQVYRLFGKIAEFYQTKLSDIYLDSSARRVKELQEVHEIIRMILELPYEFVHSEGYLKHEDEQNYDRMIKSTRTIWRSTLGQYLGRLKELDEMIRRKWLHRYSEKQIRLKLQKEMEGVIVEMNENYKMEIGCRLHNSCQICHKRPCASERFLRQIDFFLTEFLDFLSQDYPDILEEDDQMARIELIAS